jgi:hypothetical protein
VRPPAVEGDLYSNGVLYANMGGEPTYSNVAEVCFKPIAKLKVIKKNVRIKKNSFVAWRLQLPAGDSRGREAGGEIG